MAERKLPGLTLALALAATPVLAGVYQWRDEHGRLHFGDRPPATAEAQVLAAPDPAPAREALTVRFHRQDFTLSAAGQARLDRTLPAVHHLYRQLFGLDLRRTVEVNLHLFRDKPAFDAWVAARTGDPRSHPIAGIYLPETNEVAVWRRPNEEDVVATLIHEASHVIMGQLSPRAPAWLQEGMAEYFEGLEVGDDGLQVVPLTRSHARIRDWIERGELISVRSYLGLSNREWRQMAHDASSVPYTLAWGLVYFGLSEPSGKRLLRELMQNLEKNQQWAGLDIIDARYPGGVTRLDYDFFRWAQGQPQTHRYESMTPLAAD